MHIIKLTENQLNKIRTMAEERELPKYTKGVKNKKFDGAKDKETNVEAHIMGLMGEIAAGELLGTEIDTNTSLDGDEGYDLIIKNLLTVEVKTRSKKGYAFALPDNHFSSFNTDIGILAYKLSESKVGLKGWTTKVHFINESHIVNFGYGDRLAIEPSNMLPIDSLQGVAGKLRKGN